MRRLLKFIHENTIAKKNLILNIYSIDINFINKWIFLLHKFLGRRPSDTVWVSTGKSVCIALYSYYFIDSQLWDKGVSLTLHMRGKCVSPHHNGQGAVRPDRRSKNMPLPGSQILISQFQKWEFISGSQQLFLALGSRQHGQRCSIKLIQPKETQKFYIQRYNDFVGQFDGDGTDHGWWMKPKGPIQLRSHDPQYGFYDLNYILFLFSEMK